MNALSAKDAMFMMAQRQHCSTLKGVTENMKFRIFAKLWTIFRGSATNYLCYIVELKRIMIKHKPFLLGPIGAPKIVENFKYVDFGHFAIFFGIFASFANV